MERLFFEIVEVMEGVEDDVGVVEEVGEDGNSFLDFIFMIEEKDWIRFNYLKELDMFIYFIYF